MFKRVCIAVSFSPNTEALLAEAALICKKFKASLTVVHVGSLEAEKITYLYNRLQHHGLHDQQIEVIAQSGIPSKVILQVCHDKKIDLLIAGALKKENLLGYYIGSVGRTVLRKSPCSVLVLTQPEINRSGFKDVVTLADETPHIRETLQAACLMSSQWVHALRELKLFGLTLAATGQTTAEEYDKLQHELVEGEIRSAEKLLEGLDKGQARVNIKVVTGKPGYEVGTFARKKEADLLVVGAPERRFIFLDRFFSNDLEYLFADLPCNLLMVNPAKQ